MSSTKSETPSSMRGTWPLPQDRLSWLIAGLLFAGLIVAYYQLFYPRLEEANNKAYTFTEQRDTSAEQDETKDKFKLEVALPAFISNLTKQTLFLSVSNLASDTVTIKVVPSVELECDRDPETSPCVEEADYYVFLSVPDGSQPTLAEGGYLLFSDIAPNASVSQELTIEVVGLTQAAKGVADSAAADDQVDADTPKPKPRVTVSLKTIQVTKVDDVSTDAAPVEFSPEKVMVMEIDAPRAAVQGVMSFLLLPPWANGFIPFLAIFIVYLFGIPETLSHCYPQTRNERTRREKIVAWVKFIGWLVILVSVAMLVLWTLTQLAVVVLAGEPKSTLYIPIFLLVAWAISAWLIDWCVIRLPAGQPETNAGNPTPPTPSDAHSADGAGRPETNAGNPTPPTLQLNKWGKWLLALSALIQFVVVFQADERRLILIIAVVLVNLALLAWLMGWRGVQPADDDNRDQVTMAVNAAAINIQPPAGQPMTMAVNAATLTIGPPDGQPMTMAVNAAALTIGPPDGQPMTMAVNPAALNIQPPDGQPMTMAVNAATLTLQLNGDHPGHGCHPPAALPGQTPPPAAESALVPIEPPPPPATPKRTSRRKQPTAAERAAAERAAAEQAAAERAAAERAAAERAAAERAAAEQAAAEKAAADKAAAEKAAAEQVAPPPNKSRRRGLSAAPVVRHRPKPAPPAPPEPDVPQQPEGVALQEGDIYKLPPKRGTDAAPQPPAPDAAPEDPPPDQDPF